MTSPETDPTLCRHGHDRTIHGYPATNRHGNPGIRCRACERTYRLRSGITPTRRARAEQALARGLLLDEVSVLVGLSLADVERVAADMDQAAGVGA